MRGNPELSEAGSSDVVPPIRERHVSPRTWTAARVLGALRDWSELVGRPPRIFEWCPASGRWAGKPPSSWALWEREYPRWPSPSTVMNHHWVVAGGAAGGGPAGWPTTT
jgi:hypothetical protein